MLLHRPALHPVRLLVLLVAFATPGMLHQHQSVCQNVGLTTLFSERVLQTEDPAAAATLAASALALATLPRGVLLPVAAVAPPREALPLLTTLKNFALAVLDYLLKVAGGSTPPHQQQPQVEPAPRQMVAQSAGDRTADSVHHPTADVVHLPVGLAAVSVGGHLGNIAAAKAGLYVYNVQQKGPLGHTAMWMPVSYVVPPMPPTITYGSAAPLQSPFGFVMGNNHVPLVVLAPQQAPAKIQRVPSLFRQQQQQHTPHPVSYSVPPDGGFIPGGWKYTPAPDYGRRRPVGSTTTGAPSSKPKDETTIPPTAETSSTTPEPPITQTASTTSKPPQVSAVPTAPPVGRKTRKPPAYTPRPSAPGDPYTTPPIVTKPPNPYEAYGSSWVTPESPKFSPRGQPDIYADNDAVRHAGAAAAETDRLSASTQLPPNFHHGQPASPPQPAVAFGGTPASEARRAPGAHHERQPPAYTPRPPPAYTPRPPPAYTPHPTPASYPGYPDLEDYSGGVSYRARRHAPAAASPQTSESILLPQELLRAIFEYLQERDSEDCVKRLICQLAADPSIAGQWSVDTVAFMTSLPTSSPAEPWLAFRESAVLGGRATTPDYCAASYPSCKRTPEEQISLADRRLAGFVG